MFGNRRAHVAALIISILCLVVAIATTQALAGDTPQPSCIKLGKVGVCPTLNTVKFMFATTAPTTASVSLDGALTVLDSRAKKAHSITIRSIAPAMSHSFIVKVTPKRGKPTTWGKGSFPTGKIGSVPTALTSSGNKLLLNGVPHVPVMMSAYSCGRVGGAFVQGALSLATQTVFVHTNADSCDPSSLDVALANRMWLYATDDTVSQQLGELPELLGGSARFSEPALDWGCNRTTQTDLYNQLRAHSGTVQVPIIGVTTRRCPNQNAAKTTDIVNSSFWMVLVAGGAGLEYYAGDVVVNGQNILDPTAPRQARKDALELAVLEPAIANGRHVAYKISPQSLVKMNTWSYGGVTYAVAVNMNNSPTTASFTLPDTRAIAATVLWEGRTLKLKAKTISDSFAPLAVHIYKLMPPTKK